MSIVLIALLVSACAATATRKEGPDSAATAGTLRVRSVEARVSPKAKEQLPDSIKFDLNALSSTVERAVAASNLKDPASANTLDVEITNVYIRGTVTAVMFGMFAGADNISGDVRVLDRTGRALRSFEVNASYAFGGRAGGQDSVRINYLYEKFAELTRDQLRDERQSDPGNGGRPQPLAHDPQHILAAFLRADRRIGVEPPVIVVAVATHVRRQHGTEELHVLRTEPVAPVPGAKGAADATVRIRHLRPMASTGSERCCASVSKRPATMSFVVEDKALGKCVVESHRLLEHACDPRGRMQGRTTLSHEERVDSGQGHRTGLRLLGAQQIYVFAQLARIGVKRSRPVRAIGHPAHLNVARIAHKQNDPIELAIERVIHRHLGCSNTLAATFGESRWT